MKLNRLTLRSETDFGRSNVAIAHEYKNVMFSSIAQRPRSSEDVGNETFWKYYGAERPEYESNSPVTILCFDYYGEKARAFEPLNFKLAIT